MKIVSKIASLTSSITLLALLGACASAPDSIVQVPLTARAQPPVAAAANNGAIFQSASYRPLFEDRRARLVGDILVINIVEKTSAGKAAASSASKSGAAGMGIPSVVGLPLKTLQGTSLEASSSLKYDDKGAQTASNNFTGTIGVTVIEVLPNGNLLVSGEKQVALDKGSEFIRFSGVVNPDTISAGNIVSSTQVAEARVEYRTNSTVDKAQAMSMLARFFYSLLPL
ncbi:MAG: flagellar basal body L-ring protein FlgH [Pseudomonadota bacterium]